MTALLFLSALGLAFAGYTFLCAAARAQGRTLWSVPLADTSRRALKISGHLLLAMSAWPWMAAEGTAMGFVGWLFCILPLAAFPVIFSWPYFPRSTVAAAMGAVPAAVLIVLLV